MTRLLLAVSALALIGASGCGKDKAPTAPAAQAVEEQRQAPGDASAAQPATQTAARDPFTYANYDAVRVTHLDLDLNVLFDEQALDGTATLSFERIDPAANRLVLDANDLDIRLIEAEVAGAWLPAEHALGPDDPVMGSSLDIALPQDATRVRITYRTSRDADGLQWLSPAQTAGKTHPFMYSQNQAINARSMAPVQDTPAVRMTYTAVVRTPPDLLAVMSAEQDGGPRDGEYRFRMPQPVPAYLLAIAVGDLDFRAINETIGVYAEPSVVAAAAREFDDTPSMEKATAALYGPYRWGRYDLLVLPPSFPFGGMENPRLSFLTPTLIAGDKSLTGTVAHELAHSWSGNLVTNATWSDAWLNEGLTSYVENRVIEIVYGRDRAVMEQSLAMNDLRDEIADLPQTELSRLRLPSTLNHPDDAFSDVAYSKGQFFLQFLEDRFGRDAFDPFLKAYFDRFAFKAVTTEDFRGFLMDNLVRQYPDKVTAAEIDEWLNGEGLPDTAPKPAPKAFEAVETDIAKWISGTAPAASIKSMDWTTQEWLHFINALPDDIEANRLKELDFEFDLTNSRNAEIAFAWYMRGLKSDYAPVKPAVEDFLQRVGRGKFLYPLYKQLVEQGDLADAERIFEKARAGYHPIAQRRVQETLQARN
jgi:aminopeptidase N